MVPAKGLEPLTTSMTESSCSRLKLVPLCWGLRAALVALCVLCWLAVLVAPRLAHGWRLLFSTEPAGSRNGLLPGAFASILLM